MPSKRKAPPDDATTRRATRRRPAKDVTPDDELNLLPSTPGPRPTPSRLVMDCVEIATPRAVATAVQNGPSTPSRQLRPVPTSPLFNLKAVRRPPTPPSPSKRAPATPSKRPSSPKKGRDLPSPVKLPSVLPAHLVPCLRLQKRAILDAIRSSVDDLDEKDDSSTNATAYSQLQNLLHGTATRGEGNSCLLLGPRGSGKTSLVERAIQKLPEKPIVIRLSGYTQQNDRLALREIARQLSQQTGKSFLRDLDEEGNGTEEKPNPFIDPGPTISIPPPSHLPALISVLPTLSRPTVVILDAFDLFAHHARQSLLYCLLDTVQSCKVGQDNNGLAVIGITTRIDTINLLEKRVKSRFSGRMIRAAPPTDPLSWMNTSRCLLSTPLEHSREWNALWASAVDTFLEDRKVVDTLNDTFALTRDVRMLKRILTALVTNLRTSSPFPTVSHITSAVSSQRLCQKFSNLQALSYPSICLLVAAMHAYSAGHDMITFEMLYDAFREQFRASSAAPIQIEGGSIGMAKCTREVLMRSFEELVSTRMFTSVAAPSSNIAPEFVRYHCHVERVAVKQAVNAAGQTNVKKWLNKAS